MKILLVAATLLLLIKKTNSKHFLVKTIDLTHLSPSENEFKSSVKGTTTIVQKLLNKVTQAQKQGEDFAGGR